MNTFWKDILLAAGARIENGMTTDFGDLAGELCAGRDATVVCPLDHLGLLDVVGADATPFLHNQLTSDINHLPVDHAHYSAWCSAKGRMQASFVICRQTSGFRALLSADIADPIRLLLQKYVLRSRVTLTDPAESVVCIGVSGIEASAHLASAELPVPSGVLTLCSYNGATVVRIDESRFVVMVAVDRVSECWTRLSRSARPVGVPAWQWLDIRAGISMITAATREAFVPQMVGFDLLGGVSFQKGCYPGQEVVARAKYLGKVKRHLYRVHTSVSPAAGMSIVTPESPEHACGMVVTAAPSPDGGFDALIVLQEGQANTPILGFGTQGGTIQACEPVFP